MAFQWKLLVAVLLAGSARAQVIEVSADDPELAAAAAKSLSLQFPNADIRALKVPDNFLTRVVIRRVDVGSLWIEVTRGTQRVERTLALGGSASTLDLGETIALVVPELIGGLPPPSRTEPAAAPRPLRRLLAIPGPPAVVGADPPPKVKPPALKTPPLEVASVPARPGTVPERSTVPGAQLAWEVAAAMLIGSRVMPGLDAQLLVNHRARVDFGLCAGVYLDPGGERGAGVVVPIGVRAGLGIQSDDQRWLGRLVLGFGVLVPIRANQTDVLPTVSGGVEVERRLTGWLALGVRVGVTSSLSPGLMLDSDGKPAPLSSVWFGLGLTVRYTAFEEAGR